MVERLRQALGASNTARSAQSFNLLPVDGLRVEFGADPYDKALKVAHMNLNSLEELIGSYKHSIENDQEILRKFSGSALRHVEATIKFHSAQIDALQPDLAKAHARLLAAEKELTAFLDRAHFPGQVVSLIA